MGKTIVIMPGGFHPFHAGHLALYQSAQRAFPDAEVFVAATNDTAARPFPFAVKEKLAKLAGVEPGHFVQVKSPFRAEEITAGFDPQNDNLIFVRSEKDANKPPQAGGVKRDGSPSYLQPLLGAKKLEPFAKHAYMAYLPTVEFGPGMTSATQIRTAWPQLNEKRKTALVMSLYPRTQGNTRLAATVVKLLDAAIGGITTEAFGRGNVSPLDKQLKKEVPKNAAEIAGNSLAVIGGVGSAVAGLIKGISFVSPDADWAAAGYVLAGGFGAILGGALGMIPGAAVAGSSKSFKRREKIKADRLAKFIEQNPQLPADLEKFVTNLVSQTPKSILKMSNYITHLMYGGPESGEGTGITSAYTSMTGDETEQRTKELVKLVAAYFLQQEKQWEQLASKYSVHPDTLYQIYNSLNQNDIENRWLEGLKLKITAPVQQGVEENQGWAATLETVSANGTIANTSGAGAGMTASYQRRENQPVSEDYLDERRL